MTTRLLPPNAVAPRLSVAMIVRDSATALAATLDCVQNLADEIVVVDTVPTTKLVNMRPSEQLASWILCGAMILCGSQCGARIRHWRLGAVA